MTILCGTDFSEPAARAANAAAAIGKRLGESVRLVHAVEHPSGEPEARERLRLEAARIGAESELLSGASDEALVACAEKVRARLIVLGALGRRSGPLWRLGSTADRAAETSHLPVLVARDPQPFEEWSRAGRELSIVVGVDATATADAALRWVGELEAAGPCRVVCAHVFWPPQAKGLLRAEGGLPIGTGNPQVEREIEKSLRARIQALRASRPFTIRLLGGLGRTADHLAQIAVEEKADLVVVGARQETGWTRLWHGSVSQGVMDLATTNVASVPFGWSGAG